MLSKNKQSIPLLTTTLISPSISPSQILNNLNDSGQIFVKANNLIRSNSSKINRVQSPLNEQNNTSDSLVLNNNNYYFKYKNNSANQLNNSTNNLRNSNLSIQSTSYAQLNKPNFNSSSQDLIYTSNNSLINSSMVMNRYQDSNMAQYTKFTKNIFTESYNSTNGGIKLDKSPSRGSNFSTPMPSVINGTPLSIVQNSAGLQPQYKTERLKASPGLGRSSTMKYTKSYMDTNNLQKQPVQTHTQHFNFSNTRKVTIPPNQSQQQSQQQESISKKDFINVLNNIQRSSSIKLGREKTSLSNYFTSLSNSNKINNQSNGSVNGSTNQMGFNFMSSSNNLNSINSQFSKIQQLQRPKHSILKANNLNLNKYLDQLVDQSNGLKVSSSFKSNRNEFEVSKEVPMRVRVSQDNESDDSQHIVEYIDEQKINDKQEAQQITSQMSNSNSKKGSIKNNKTSTTATTTINTRPISRVSYVSRDINDSYAYTNVKQYIDENDLMPPEKAESIKRWVREVNFYVDDWEKRTIEINIVQE